MVLGLQERQRFYGISLMGVHCQLGAYCHLVCTIIPEAKQCRWSYKPCGSWTCCLLSHSSFFFLTNRHECAYCRFRLLANCKFLQYSWKKNYILSWPMSGIHEGLPIQVTEQVNSETQHANASFSIMVLVVWRLKNEKLLVHHKAGENSSPNSSVFPVLCKTHRSPLQETRHLAACSPKNR